MLGDMIGNNALDDVERLVIKIGTSVLADERLQFDQAFIGQLARQVAHLRRQGRDVLVVTSGAIAAGRTALRLEHRPRTLAEKQAAAAVGQIHLMRFYRSAFEHEALDVAQVLLTHGDFQNRRRFLNARQTLLRLLQLGVVPLINENDTISVEEILVGDNDNLSALVAALVDADALVLLCDVDGLYTSDPGKDPRAQHIPVVEDVEQAMAYAQDTHNPGSTGGMHTKLEAAQHAAAYGIPTFITHGSALQGVERLLHGGGKGTLILPRKRLNSRKHWIVHTLKPQGQITVDAGALNALCKEGKSLLPAGVSAVAGRFGPGDPVDVLGPDARPFARGLVSYSALEVERLRGHQSSEIATILGYKTQDEIIHRNHLVLL